MFIEIVKLRHILGSFGSGAAVFSRWFADRKSQGAFSGLAFQYDRRTEMCKTYLYSDIM